MSNHRATPEQIADLEAYRLRLAVTNETFKRLGDPKIPGSRKYWKNLAVADMTDAELQHWLNVKAEVRAELEVAS